jgi:hypothetical protein
VADTIVYVLIKTHLDRAKAVAQAAAALDGVQWAAEVSGPYDVIVGAKVGQSALLGRLVTAIDALPAVRETQTAPMSSFHAGRGARGVIEPP